MFHAFRSPLRPRLERGRLHFQNRLYGHRMSRLDIANVTDCFLNHEQLRNGNDTDVSNTRWFR